MLLTCKRDSPDECLDPNQPSTSRPVRTVAFDTEQIAAATLRLKVARRKARLDKRAAELEALAKAKQDAEMNPANIAAKKIFNDKIKKVMRRIERNYPRCHPAPEPAPVPPRLTSTMLRGFVEAAASGLITDQLQPNPDHPHVAARMRNARAPKPVPVPEDEENDDSTQPGDSDSEDNL